MCSYWAKCKYPFFADIKQLLSNMNPSIHRALLSLVVTSILLETETVNNCLNTRAADYNTANISTRYSKFPGVYSPEFLGAVITSGYWGVQFQFCAGAEWAWERKISQGVWTKTLYFWHFKNKWKTSTDHYIITELIKKHFTTDFKYALSNIKMSFLKVCINSFV